MDYLININISMKYYNDVYPENKEDLIGSYWKCPHCHKKVTITESGINHLKGRHGYNYDLEDLYDMRVWNINRIRRLFFGDDRMVT